jgi:hypothetical protein
MSNRKVEMISLPRGVWATSGWNCTANSGKVRCSNAATGELGLDAVATKPSGGAST